MVADNWVKKNPVVSGLVGIALTCVCSIAIAKATWTREDKAAIQIELEKKVDKIDFNNEKIRIDRQFDKVDNKLDSKADLSIVKSMDKKLDLILANQMKTNK